MNQGYLVEYKRTDAGESVISRLNTETLQAVATISDGTYHASTAGQVELDVVLDGIARMEKSLFGSREFSEAEERFQFFLLPGLLLIMLNMFLSDRRKEGGGTPRYE